MNLEKAIKGCINNDRRSQRWLYERYFNALIPMCMRYTRDRDEAVICLNNGFLKIFKNLHTLQKVSSLEAWMKRIIYHSISDFLRSKAGKVRFLELENRDKVTNNAGYQNLLMEDLLSIIDSLPKNYSEVFILYAIHGYKHREISDLKQISEGTSKWLLSEARKTLREKLKHYGQGNYYAG